MATLTKTDPAAVTKQLQELEVSLLDPDLRKSDKLTDLLAEDFI